MSGFVRMLAVAAVVAALVVALAWLLQDRLIYLPSGRVAPPADAGLPQAREIEVLTDDGLRLSAWYSPTSDATAAGAVLVLPGNAGNRSLRAPLAMALNRKGFDVLLAEYRGYGGNPGRPSQQGLLADGRAARRALREHTSSDKVAYYGESLGAGVATMLATEHPPDALVLRSPFVSLAEIGRIHYGWLPVGFLLRDRFEVAEQIGNYDGPVLVGAGSEDTIVPPEQSRRVAQAAAAKHVEIRDAGHNDIALLAGRDLIGAVVRFLDSEGFTGG